ncbi:MAG TPA: anthranilate synthase component I family protein [Pyrinomonadaceae bacterium]|nr:anthranilate synthase component I family protein [Pyrinomonadaceae bacterium]
METAISQLEPASFADFERETSNGNVVAVVKTLPGRTPSPVHTFARVAAQSDYAFLFESVEGREGVSKYSFIGSTPYMIVRGRGDQTLIERNGSIEIRRECALEYIKQHFAERKLARRFDLGPLTGGAVGYVGYRAARWFEPALKKHDEIRPDTDDTLLMFYRTLVVFDRAQQETKIVSVVFTGETQSGGGQLRELYNSALSDIERIEKLVTASEPPASSGKSSPLSPKKSSVRSNRTREDFQEAVRNVKDRILAGDCYQVVLSQRFTRRVSADPLSIYRALRTSNPAPYLYFLKLGDQSIIGASPEMLVRCRDRELEYRPIAGTRRRGSSEAEDLALAEEMRSDEKEVAEHMMLVDLGRNDLGRVAEYGSVRVEELMSVERFSKVQHLVSSLRARLRDGCDRFDALAACFPAGTVTGAPKVKAMEIIRQLEPESRGVYAGAILYVDYDGNLDSCIAIRTIVIREGEASVQAGAGIVADSVPEREFDETFYKAQAMLRAIEMAEYTR